MYIALLIISLIAGVVLTVLCFCFDIGQNCGLCGVVLVLYFIYATVVLCCHQTKEEDFDSLDDNTLNKFDDDIYDDSLDEDDVNVSYDSEPEDYNDELSEDYSDEE